MVDLTKPVAQVIRDNEAVNKPDMRRLFTDLIGGIEAEAQTRAEAVAAVKPVQIAVKAASSALDRNGNLWITPAHHYRITAAVIQGAPYERLEPKTAAVDVLTAPGGVRMVWRDGSGTYERLYDGAQWGPWIKAARDQDLQEGLGHVAAAAAEAIAAESGRAQGAEGRLNERIAGVEAAQVQYIGRGDYAVAATLDGAPIWAVSPGGRHRLVLDDWTVADLAARLDIEGGAGGGQGGASPAAPDLLGAIDGWSVWQAPDGLLTFTALIWGDQPREYVMRPGGAAWINGRAEVPIRLVYGDQSATGQLPGHLDHPCHIATLEDGAGQVGLNGAAPAGPASGLTRAGSGFGGVVADRLAASDPVTRWALVRSEAVTGAALADLSAGQPLDNLRRALTEAERILPRYARRGVAQSVSILHGAGDDSTSYAADLLGLLATLDVEIGARRIYLYQPGGTSERSDFRSAGATVEALRQKGRLPVTLVSPTYWCGLRAGAVAALDGTSLTMLAELEAHAERDPEWLPPVAFYASRTGAVISVDFEVAPDASLIAPTTGLAVDGADIESVAVVADPETDRLTRLQITLTAAPAGPVMLRYAQSPTGRVAGDLTDDWSAPSITGGTLRRYACAFTMEVQ